MCLITPITKPIIAERNIKCYKVGLFCSMSNSFRSEYQGFFYVLGIQYECKMSLGIETYTYDTMSGLILDSFLCEYYGVEQVNAAHRRRAIQEKVLVSISRGFHSIKSLERAIDRESETGLDIAVCIIPKGATYYKDNTDLLVSNKIIIKKII